MRSHSTTHSHSLFRAIARFRMYSPLVCSALARSFLRFAARCLQPSSLLSPPHPPSRQLLLFLLFSPPCLRWVALRTARLPPCCVSFV